MGLVWSIAAARLNDLSCVMSSCKAYYKDVYHVTHVSVSTDWETSSLTNKRSSYHVHGGQKETY